MYGLATSCGGPKSRLCVAKLRWLCGRRKNRPMTTIWGKMQIASTLSVTGRGALTADLDIGTGPGARGDAPACFLHLRWNED
jgi:hypothetical protein